MLTAFAAIACQPAPDAADGLVASPWVYEEDTASAPPLPADALATTLREVVDALVAIDPHDVYDSWDEAALAYDAACPARGSHNGQPLFEGDCTATSGAAFYGYELVNRIFGFWIAFPDVDGFQNEFSWMTGNSRMELPDGRVLTVGGDALWSDRIDADGHAAQTLYLYGSFGWTRGTDTPGWMDEPLEVELHMDAVDRGDGGREVRWRGGVTGLSGAVSAFRMEDLALRDVACPTEPSGSLAFLGRDGHWYAVVFDAVCDGCARVLGPHVDAQVCADWAPVLGWEVSPWAG